MEKICKSQLKKLAIALLTTSLINTYYIFSPYLIQKSEAKETKDDKEKEQAQKTINQVKIEGLERASEEYVRSVILSREGKEFDPITLRQDIERIYNLELFDEVKAEFKEGTLVFKLKEKPIISDIQVEGRKELSEEKFKEVMKMKKGDFLDRRKLKKQIDDIINAYQKEGFIFTKVTPQIELLPQNRANVKLKIKEGEKYYVKKIVFSGSQKVEEEQNLKYLQTKETSTLKRIIGEGKLDLTSLEVDKDNLRNSYLDSGFIDAEIKSPTVIFNPAREETLIFFRVSEGPRYKIKSVDVEGDMLFKKSQIKENLKTEEGEYFSRKKVVEDIDWLSSLYQDIGFAQVRVNPLISKNIEEGKEEGEVSLTYQINKGNIFYIRRINITGNTRTRDFVIRRYFSLLEGQIFSRTSIMKSYIELMRTGFFEKVEINPVFLQDGKVDLDIEVKEGRVGAVSLGGGFSPQFGNLFQSLFLLFQGQISNFRGLGQNLGIYLAIGGGFAFFNFFFQDDHAFDTDYIMGVNLFRYQSFFLPFLKISTGGKFNTGLFLTERTKFILSPGMEILDVYDRRTGGRIPFYQDDIGAGFFRSNSRFLRAEIRNDTRDNIFAPTRGKNIILWSKIGGVFGGDLYFVKAGIASSFFFPLKWGLVFSPNIRIGLGGGLTSSRFLPYPERFFAGGIYSIRGFDYFSLGPKRQYISPSGVVSQIVLGGNKSVISNFELVLPVSKQIGLFIVLFSDVGQVFAEYQNINPADFRASYGVEIRWISPFGPIRLSFGLPLIKKKGDTLRLFDFSLGLFTFYPELEEY